ncbi:hypothetical protein K8353_01385 [Burkholderia contaminans]|nr:hypothetical protein [Burkholderia contaminans]
MLDMSFSKDDRAFQWLGEACRTRIRVEIVDDKNPIESVLARHASSVSERTHREGSVNLGATGADFPAAHEAPAKKHAADRFAADATTAHTHPSLPRRRHRSPNVGMLGPVVIHHVGDMAQHRHIIPLLTKPGTHA